MKLEGQIGYEMLINEPKGQHGIGYQSNIENDLASMMMAAQSIDINLQMLREKKKESKGEDKKMYAKSISEMSVLLRGLNKIIMTIANNYEPYIESLQK